MPRALFTSKNLMGDALYIQPSLKTWAAQHPEWDIDLLTLGDYIAPLYKGMGIPRIRVIFDENDQLGASYYAPGEYSFRHTFDVGEAFKLGDKEKIHIAQAYMKLLGLEVPGYPPKVEYKPEEGPSESGLVLLSLFSNSCASREGKPPNKMLSFAVWLPILTLARQLGKIALLGGSADKMTAPLPVKEEEYYTGRPLQDVARLLRDAMLLITIDNGLGHLAATQGTPTILFYPNCLGKHWIVPSGNKKLFVYQMDPMELNVHTGTLVVREGIKFLLGEQYEEHKKEVGGAENKVDKENGKEKSPHKESGAADTNTRDLFSGADGSSQQD